ncbi:hypothetical protein AMS68_002855 [Peltaster fructicola]|uniref:RRM domain-containing protein n=1 Tax=Peltaster fructicola TaxID=286661 RepID=A0A6H0XRT1_9PEZI|nr:hypothetical protein AMS68_002855 [Peltaster fructicola]
MAETNRQKATLFVGGLDNAVSTQILHDAFIPFGDIVDVSMPKPESATSSDPHRGFGYVEFALVDDALEAIDNMDQSELFGRVIKVNQARAQNNANESLGSKTAVWEQAGYAAKYNISAEDQTMTEAQMQEDDPMQALEGLAQAGPRLQ